MASSFLSFCKTTCHDLLSHVAACAFWDISRFPSLRYVPFITYFTKAAQFIGQLHNYCINKIPRMQWQEVSRQIIQRSPQILTNSANILLVFDLLGFFPYKKVRIVLDVLYLARSTIGSMHTFTDGTHRIITVIQDHSSSTTKKLNALITGGILVSIGTWCLSRAYTQADHLYQGITLFDALSPMQKEGVLKHRAIHTLVQQHQMNAVIIDGVSSSWGNLHERLVGRVPNPFSEFTYEHADVQFYRVNSSTSFCAALKDAHHQFGSLVPHLQILGHGLNENGENSNQMIKLSADYFFQGSSEESACIQEHLSKQAHLFLIACDSATSTTTHPISLAQKVFQKLSHITVIGIKAIYSPLFITVWSDKNNTPQLQSHFCGDMTNRLTSPFAAIAFSNSSTSKVS